jgi:hypothetical protein
VRDSGRMPRAFLSDRSWTFDVSDDALWERLSSVEEYTQWWPWLRRFDPVGGFNEGARWHCEVAPPLPYVLRFSVHIDHIEPGRGARASVHGDVTGDAVLSVGGGGNGSSTARLRSQLAPANPVLRRVGRLARPVVEWGHDWVLDQGRRQFVASAF